MSTPRSIVRIELTPQAKQQLEQLCEKRGMTRIALMSRLFTWLVEQRPPIQTLVLSQFSGSKARSGSRDILLWLLKHRCSKPKRPVHH